MWHLAADHERRPAPLRSRGVQRLAAVVTTLSVRCACHRRQKCAVCRAPCADDGGKGAVVELDKLTRTATCPDCSHCADRDQHAAMNIKAIALSLLLTGKRPDHVNPKWIVRYDHLVPRPGQDRATW
jgi:hypothetical protein